MQPRSTYRVQLRRDFGFGEAAALVGYLSELGISHLYCSPCLQAVPGSTHGYDVADPSILSEELGGEKGFAVLVEALQARGLGLVLDIVPNHMAADPTANRWWRDVLEKGPSSPYASVFDLYWDGPVLVPILGDHYGRVLEAGELLLSGSGGHDAGSEKSERSRGAPGSKSNGDEDDGSGDRGQNVEREDPTLSYFEHRLPLAASTLEGPPEEIGSDLERLDALIQRQNYRLAWWRVADEEINYRRFFNISSLVGVRVEDPSVFEQTHRLLLGLLGSGQVEGLRVDHVDGLRDPAGYLERLARSCPEAYTVVEKILAPGEKLPADWPVAGTSGYDFLFSANNLFVAGANEALMTELYGELIGEAVEWGQVVHSCKEQIMASDLSAEVERLTSLLQRICGARRRHRDHTRRRLRDALVELICHFEVYRTYVKAGLPPSEQDRQEVAGAIARVGVCQPEIDGELLVLLGDLALGVEAGALSPEAEFSERLQQLTVAVMAKGVEDTAFYRYHRLVSLNEVGGDPGRFGVGVSEFHRAMQRLATDWPNSMITLATHDTKRSADVRARLNVLSEIPVEWRSAVGELAQVTRRHRSGGCPDSNTEYLFFQTCVGAWPLDADRAVAFMLKAAREAKVHTSWVNPDAGYEEALERFVRGALDDPELLGTLEGFLVNSRLVERGRRNSVAQTALLLTCPGVPDLYQGSELWDLSLVDPDNRRPVDFAERRDLLGKLRGEAPGALLRGEWDRGEPKMQMIRRLLRHRIEASSCYASGAYEPLRSTGPEEGSVAAFSRDGLVAAVAIRTGVTWDRTVVELPRGAWRDLLSGKRLEGGTVKAEDLVGAFPASVLERDGT